MASFLMTRSSDVIVRKLRLEDEADWLGLRKRLWPDSDEANARAWSAREDAVTLVAVHTGQIGVIGFVEVGTRAYADGCETSPVAFLEGWYVDLRHRGAGIGAHLVRTAMRWAQNRGLKELASDSLLENKSAHLAHLGVGFKEVERSIKYRLALE